MIYIVMAYIVMAYVVMVHAVMANIVMACGRNVQSELRCHYSTYSHNQRRCWLKGKNYTGHKHIVHIYMGHDNIGPNYVGHNYI